MRLSMIVVWLLATATSSTVFAEQCFTDAKGRFSYATIRSESPAVVYYKGRKIGVTPLIKQRLPAGCVELSVSYPQLKKVERKRVIFSPNALSVVNLSPGRFVAPARVAKPALGLASKTKLSSDERRALQQFLDRAAGLMQNEDRDDHVELLSDLQRWSRGKSYERQVRVAIMRDSAATKPSSVVDALSDLLSPAAK